MTITVVYATIKYTADTCSLFLTTISCRHSSETQRKAETLMFLSLQYLLILLGLSPRASINQDKEMIFNFAWFRLINQSLNKPQLKTLVIRANAFFLNSFWADFLFKNGRLFYVHVTSSSVSSQTTSFPTPPPPPGPISSPEPAFLLVSPFRWIRVTRALGSRLPPAIPF